MKHRTSFLTRCLAMALALMLVISGANLGAVLQVYAEVDPTINVGVLVADNYDLSAAEEDLLRSGLLTQDKVTYKNLPENLVNVDTEKTEITAESKDGWVPTTGVITYGSNTLAVDLSSGKYVYDAAELGNAFSVAVTYVYNTTEVSVDTQSALLAAPGILKQGVANTEAVKNQSGNIFILEQAMPELVSLANGGISVNIGGNISTVGFSDAVKAAISALNGQMTANGGVVNLSKMITEYEASTKTGYLLNNGAAMKAEVSSFYAHVAEIQLAMNTMVENLALFIQNGWVTETQVNQLRNLANVCKNLKEGLAVVEADPWTAINTPNLVVEGVDYAALDAKVAALTTITEDVLVKNTLTVATGNVAYNMSMWNVNIKVILNAVNPETNAVAEHGNKTAVVTLADGATKAEVEAAIAETGVKAAALEAWAGVYAAEHFVETATALPETLTADMDYVITFNPAVYTVDIAGESAEYPYGTKVVLPAHEDPTQAYDYKDQNGTYYAQGAEVIVAGNMTFTREEGKAYTTGSLLKIIADNYGNAKIDAILTSGALNVDETVIYREPTLGELETLVVLEGSTLTVSAYDSSYNGLKWVPYSYVVDGTTYLFNGATEVTVPGDFTTVNVYYRLTLSNFSAADVKGYLDLALTLIAEAEGQKGVMDRLAGFEDQMSQLNKNMLNGLKGMIDGYAVSAGGSFSDELVAQMKQTITDITNNACAADGSLIINSIVTGYNDPNNGGLTYYYQNADYIIDQISYLSDKLDALLGDPQGKELITALLNDMNYSDYVAKLDDLNAKMAAIKADLKPVNSAINTADAAKLIALTTALTMEGEAAYTDYASPYLAMGPIIRTAERFVTVEVVVVVDGAKNTDPISATVERGSALSAAHVADMKEKVAAFVASTGIDTELWNNDYANGSALDALVGVALEEGATYTYTWTPKNYTVKINGEADQIINVKNLTVTLPGHPNAAAGMSYEYTVDGATASAGSYTFTTEQVKRLFVDGVYTITRIQKNLAEEKLVAMVNNINIDLGTDALKLTEENGTYTAITADLGMKDMMKFIMGLVQKSGYGYIGLNGEGFIYENADTGLEISLQTLIDAILSDASFNNDAVIALGENGKGKLVATTIELGNTANETQQLDFVINLTEAPAQLTSNVGLLKTVSGYFKFQANNGKLDVTVNLPDQVYAAYAAMLVAAGHVDKADVNELSQAVAIEFLYDYLLAITGSEMDMVTFTNTLKKLGIDKDLTGYNGAYTSAMNAYNNSVTIEILRAPGATLDVAVPGKPVIDKLIPMIAAGADVSTFLPLIKEYKDGGEIKFAATGALANVDKTYYALIADVQASGVTNKFAAPSSYSALASETSTLAGYSAMMLLADVPGDLTISGNTILDLNGKNVAGKIHATGKLFIIDSSMDTYAAGTVDGVSGNAMILAGNYKSDVSAYLKAGYYMDGTTVRNTMYHIEDVNNTVNFVLNADFYENDQMPNAMAVAIDIATDLALNYALSASLAIDGNSLIDVKLNDLVGLYASDNKGEELIKQVLSWFTIGEAGWDQDDGFEAVVNLILADLLDFSAITSALENNTALATHEVELKPWTVTIEHIADGNYATVNFGSNDELPKTFNVALTVESKYNDKAAELTGELANIVVADETTALVDIPTPSYSNQSLNISAAGKAIAVLDLSADNDYAHMIGVLLAYGNPAKAGAVAEAINGNDMAALKVVIDNTSVKEIFNSMKKMARNKNFATMAAEVGITADVASAGELEAIWHLYLCAAGKALEELNITGMDSKLGGLYNAETGCYELSKSKMFEKEISAKGYSALVNLEVTEVTLKVKLFGEGCDLRDPNHDGVIDTRDVTYMRKVLIGETEIICNECADFNADGVIDTRDLTSLRNYLVNG